MVGTFTTLGVLAISSFLLLFTLRGRTAEFDPWILVSVVLYANLASIQGTHEGQVNLDDGYYTPFYLALPAWLAVTRGMLTAIRSAALGALVLALIGSLHPLGDPSQALLGEIFPGEWAGVQLALVSIAVVAGLIRSRPHLAAAAPAIWVIWVGMLQPDALYAVETWRNVAFAVAVSAFGMVIDRFARANEAPVTT